MDAQELRAWMYRKGWSVRQLAGALGVDPSTVQKWRSGQAPISKLTTIALRNVTAKDAPATVRHRRTMKKKGALVAGPDA